MIATGAAIPRRHAGVRPLLARRPLRKDAAVSRRSTKPSLTQLALPAAVCGLLTTLAIEGGQLQWVSFWLGLTAASFVLVLNAPAWGVLPLLIVELTISNYFVAPLGMSLRLAVTLLATVLSLPVITRVLLASDPALRRVLWPALAFIALVTVGNFAHADGDYVFKYFRWQIGQLLVLVLAVALLRDRHDLKRVTMGVLALGVVSGFAAIVQHYAPSIAPFGTQDAEAVRHWKGRAVGLADNPVLLANGLTFALMPLLGILVSRSLTLTRYSAALVVSVHSLLAA